MSINRPLLALALGMFTASAFAATTPATPATPAAPAKHVTKHKIAKAASCKAGETLVKGKCKEAAPKAG